jgi:polyhydroxyalkanoate synthase
MHCNHALAAKRAGAAIHERVQIMSSKHVPIDAALDAVRRVQFGMTDIMRRAHGNAFGALGFDPTECPYRVLASGAFWRLRAYTKHDSAQSLLIVAAPIKRPYIWDLAPRVSAIRYCLGHGLQVRLVEWLPASRETGNNGLAEYAEAIGECVEEVSKAGAKPFLAGHSLGGTLAAMFAALAPDAIRGLVLLGTPLCFQPSASRFRDALVSLVPSSLSDAEPWPGSLLSHVSALASPSTFIWSRLADAALSVADGQALDIHARVERWALDEVPLPGKLCHQLIEWLYRENRFCHDSMKIGGKAIGPHSVSVPTLAVVNTADDVAPLGAIEPFIEAMSTTDARVIAYPGEIGVCLQHLGMLIGREAQARVWPEIVSWIDARR